MMQATGKSLDEVLDDLAERSGLLGLSGVSGDVRDLEEAAADGNERAKLALDVFISAVRHYLGAYLVELGGADAIVFTGGIGENGATVRSRGVPRLEKLGIVLDPTVNATAQGRMRISAAEQPRADLDHADERRIDCRPAVRENCCRAVNPEPWSA